MTSLSSVRFDHRGFTLVELLVALAMVGLIMAAVVTFYMTGTRIQLTGVNRVNAHEAARAVMVMMGEDLQLAGYGYPTATGLPKIEDATPTSITFWADLTNASTILSSNVNAGDTVLSVDSAVGITSGDTIYLVNGGQWEALTVTSASGNTITVGAGLTASYPQGAQVGRPKAITYSWNAGTNTISKDDGGGPQLLADSVQSFQLRYFDTNDGEIGPPINLEDIRRIAIAMTAQSGPSPDPATFSITFDVRPRNL